MRKKVAAKIPLSKLIWQWTEEVNSEDVTVDHLHMAYRLQIGKCKSCRKNCSANPACLRGLGEGAWLKEGNYHQCLEDDLNELRSNIRKEGEFVGLKNLGATCYVNTFLQLWFHNLSFRRAVYSFVESCVENHEFPSTVCGHLQLLFGMLESSARKNIDPSPFVKCLGLDTDLQQDAQEFSKLLLNLLDQTSEVGNFLCKEFCGEYDYCTKCKFCGNVSKSASKFYELDLSIQGHKDIKGCLEEFFKEELLNNENQYHCAYCDCRRDAHRQIVIRSFPKTLNLQLLRFVFDKTTWNKKKLSSYLSFPDLLDMSLYISSENLPKEGAIYELTAVLIHRGPSASSGHYVAHVKDLSTHLWHKFNDESVDQLKSGKNLDLDAINADDYEADLPKPSKKPRLKKNIHSSKDAYMLVYSRKGEDSAEFSIAKPKIPTVVQQAVKKDNDDFHMTINSMIDGVREQNEVKSRHHKEISTVLKRMYDMELVDLISDCFWVPTAWLKQTFTGSETVKKTFSTEKFMCPHKKLDPDKVASMKCVPRFAADVLFKMCKEEVPRIGNEMLCFECVKQRCLLLQNKASIKKDHEIVTKLLKDSNSANDGFLVGRESLRYWKTMAMRQMEERSNKSESERTEESIDETPRTKSATVDCESSDEDLNFNEDLLCEHGNLTTNSKDYRVVTEAIWNIITKYFTGYKEYKVKGTVRSCQICTDDQCIAAQTALLDKALISEQKSKLYNLFHQKKRPMYEDLFELSRFFENGSFSFYGISSEFARNWREYLQNPSKNILISELKNQILLCPHNKLLYDAVSSLDAACTQEEDEPYIVLLWPEEWDYISKNFIVDFTILIEKDIVNARNQNISESKPQNLKIDGVNGERKVGKPDQENCENSAAGPNDGYGKLNGSANQVTANITGSGEGLLSESQKVILKYVPDLCEECMAGKQIEKERNLRNYEKKEIYVRKIIPDVMSLWKKEVFADVSKQSVIRKTRRLHTARGEKKITVSSTMTLKQLKIEIMHILYTPPFDQNLWMNGNKLTEDGATLGELSIIPGSTIFLVADEPDEKSLEMLPVVPDRKLVAEEGFKGTGLLSTQ